MKTMCWLQQIFATELEYYKKGSLTGEGKYTLRKGIDLVQSYKSIIDQLSQVVELLGEMKKKCYFETDSGEWICRHCGVNKEKGHSLYCETKSIDAFLKEVKGSE